MKIKLLFSLLLASSVSFTQSVAMQDTLFVYDTIYITDTVLLTSYEIPELERASLKEVISKSNTSKILFFPEQKTATFLTSDILLTDNQFKNSIEMKKVSFIGVFVFALQTMVFSQHDIGIIAGGGAHRLNASYVYSFWTNIEPQGFVSINYRKAFASDRLVFQTGLQYHYLKSSNFKDADDFHYRISSATLDISSDLDMFTLPINLQFMTKFIHFGGGVEFSHKRTPNIVNVRPDPQSSEVVLTGYKLPENGVNLTGNISVPISKRAILNLTYVKGLITEFTVTNVGLSGRINPEMKQERMELSVRYRLF
ncbi:MAG: hypothetical protein AAGG68_10905 [Bacteroidota bacterium]